MSYPIIYSSWYSFFDTGVTPGSIINKAYFKCKVKYAYSVSNVSWDCVISARKNGPVSNPVSESEANDIERTDTKINWHIPYDASITNTWITSPDISCVLQEVLDTAGNSFDGDLQIFCDGVRTTDAAHTVSYLQVYPSPFPDDGNNPRLFVWWQEVITKWYFHNALSSLGSGNEPVGEQSSDTDSNPGTPTGKDDCRQMDTIIGVSEVCVPYVQ